MKHLQEIERSTQKDLIRLSAGGNSLRNDSSSKNVEEGGGRGRECEISNLSKCFSQSNISDLSSAENKSGRYLVKMTFETEPSLKFYLWK
ncbi:hypothetical protein CEXT_85561 [Caerostris extrusa]|uniref:Uncharacterized protein n=1 Tax=Caerostris extrusa TaxID=172846 RepID=A0AAV4XDB5_CAEEX|nr:hypothetical protein CEXT_85561 [Caerostris extrusa]